MLFNFPTPYPDELLYSVIARYHIRSGNQAFKQTKHDVFNNKEVNAVYDLPTHLNILVHNLSPVWEMTVEDWIYDHTMYPYYAPFLPEERAKRLFNTMVEYKEPQHILIGDTGHLILFPKFLRYCPICNEESKANYGEYYWNRIHQAPGVLVCPIHEIKLLDSTVSIDGPRRSFFEANEENCPSNAKDKFPDSVHLMLVILTEEIERFMKAKLASKPENWLETAYLYQLSQIHLVQTSNQVYLNELCRQMQEFYGDELLRILESEIHYTPKNPNYWLSVIINKTMNCQHPVRHLILIHFLGFSVESFFNSKIPKRFNQPFGNGPWLCLNPVCEFYQKPVIRKLLIGKCNMTDRPLGVFQCTCGYIYNRRGPDVSDSDKFRYTRIISYGPVWENALKEYAQNKTLKELSKIFGASTDTIEKKLKEYGIPKYNGFRHKSRKKVHDWEQKDAEILEKVKEVERTISVYSDSRPVKISRSSLGDLIGERDHLLNNLDRLPNTKAYIQKLMDDKRSYTLKCISWAAHYLKSHGLIVTRAGIRSLSKCHDYSEEIKKEIEMLINSYQRPNY